MGELIDLETARRRLQQASSPDLALRLLPEPPPRSHATRLQQAQAAGELAALAVHLPPREFATVRAMVVRLSLKPRRR